MLLLCIKLNYLSPIFNMFLFFRPMAYVELFVSIVIFFLLIRYYLTIILLNLYFFLSKSYGYVSNHLIILNKKKKMWFPTAETFWLCDGVFNTNNFAIESNFRNNYKFFDNNMSYPDLHPYLLDTVGFNSYTTVVVKDYDPNHNIFYNNLYNLPFFTCNF